MNPYDIRFDLFSHNPAFGIPYIGNVLNIPGEIAGYISSALSPDDSEAARIAREQGALSSWEQRPDIPSWAKIAGDVAIASLLPPFAGKGPFKGLTKFYSQPIARAVGSGIERAPELPVVGGLFAPSKVSAYNNLADTTSTVINDLKLNKIDPFSLKKVIEDFQSGGLTEDQAKRMLNTGGEGIKEISTWVNDAPNAYQANISDPERFYNNILKEKLANKAQSIGVDTTLRGEPIAYPRWLSPYMAANNAVKQIMLSGLGVLGGNLTDVVAKNKLVGIPLKEQLPEYWKVFSQQLPTSELVKNKSSLGNFLDTLSTPRALEVNLGAEAGRKPFLENLPYATALGAGAGAGLIGTAAPAMLNNENVSGEDLLKGTLLGAAGGGLTKLGGKGVLMGMKNIEAVARNAAYREGIRRYFQNPEALQGIYEPLVRNKLNEIEQIAPQAFQELKNKNFLSSVSELENSLTNTGVTNIDDINKVVANWIDLQEEARNAGVALTEFTHFPYTKDTNLIQGMRYLSPFPVWPARNLPFYGLQAIKNPAILASIAAASSQATSEGQQHDVPFRLNQDIPIAPVGRGELYGNPLFPFMSIYQQIHEPFPQPQGQEPTGTENVINALDRFGFGPNPFINYLLQATGQIDQNRDIQDLIPWTKPIRDVGQMVGLKKFEPEAAIKTPVEMIRKAIAPEAVSNVSYPEYQVRKMLADMSLEKTGKPWYENSDYQEAMINRNNPLYKEAEQRAGLENILLYGARRIAPFKLGYYPFAEEEIRKEKQLLPEQMTTEQLLQKMNTNPKAFGYRYVGNPQPELTLRVKVNQYFDLPKESRPIFLSENPEVKTYLDWAMNEKKAERKSTIDDYLQKVLKVRTY